MMNKLSSSVQILNNKMMPGQVWYVQGCHDPVVIVMESRSNLFRAHPLVEDIEFLSDRDLYITFSENPLGYPAMIATWLILYVERSDMIAYIGKIPDELVASAIRVGRGQPDSYGRSGTKLTGPDDPRYHYQEYQLDVWKPLLNKAHRRLTRSNRRRGDAK